jgi:hypothetical protein
MPNLPVEELWFSPGDDVEVAHCHPSRLSETVRGAIAMADRPVPHQRASIFTPPLTTRKPAESAKYCSYLKAHRVAIAVTMTVMSAETCGEGVEGIMTIKA